MQEVRTPVKVPRTVSFIEPYTVTVRKPVTVYSPVTLNYFDPYSSAISMGLLQFLRRFH